MLPPFLGFAASELVASIDFSRAVRLNRSIIPDDLNKRETDILWSVPFRDDTKEVLVYLLVEHQTDPDTAISFTVHHAMDLIWEGERRGPLDRDLPKSEWQFHLVMPIVFYT